MQYFNQFLIISLFILTSTASVQAQDLHYTMYDRAPLLTNPANTGAFSGVARISSLYRSQWEAIYTTPSISVDSRIISIGKKKKDWIGGGLFYLNDRAGELDFKTVYTLLSGAYHKALDEEAKNVLTFGVQFGSVSRSIGGQTTWGTPDILEAEDNGTSTNSSAQDSLGNLTDLLGGSNNSTYAVPKHRQFNLGIRFRSQLNKDAKLIVGGSIYNPFRFNLTFDSTATNGQGVGTITPNNRSRNFKRSSIMKFHASLDYTINDKFRLRPSAFFQGTAGLTETIIQTELGYYATDNKKLVLNGGLGYRFGDALQFLVGLDYKDWRLGASYDMNLSSLEQQARYKNGFEIGLSYIIVLPNF